MTEVVPEAEGIEAERGVARSCLCESYARVTERSALASARWLGRADQEGAHEAARSGMQGGLEELPIGWEPDLNDGIRLNIRPFVTAGVLRKNPKINWNKDRGKDPDGSERLNDRPYTRAEKEAARAQSGAGR